MKFINRLEDNRKKLVGIHVRDNPDANAYLLILHRLVLETPWLILSRELQETPSALSNFYRRKCLPLLRQGHDF